MDELRATDEWQITVTDRDVQAAKRAWLTARDGGAADERVAELYRGYERLVRTQGRQLGEAFRRGHGAA